MYIEAISGKISAYNKDKKKVTISVEGSKGYVNMDGVVWRCKLWKNGKEYDFYIKPTFKYIEIPHWRTNNKYKH